MTDLKENFSKTDIPKIYALISDTADAYSLDIATATEIVKTAVLNNIACILVSSDK